MIGIVCRGAANGLERRPFASGKTFRQPLRCERPDGFAEKTMLCDETGDVRAPRNERHLIAREPVAAFEPERSALLAGQPPADRILPVRGMHRQLSDVVPSR